MIGSDKHVTRYHLLSANARKTIKWAKISIIISNCLRFSAENERILVMKYGEKSCKLIITSVAKTDEGIWRGVVTLAFRRNALQHHNYNVSILVQGE